LPRRKTVRNKCNMRDKEKDSLETNATGVARRKTVLETNATGLTRRKTV
jgi:hypothetical protein